MPLGRPIESMGSEQLRADWLTFAIPIATSMETGGILFPVVADELNNKFRVQMLPG